MGWYGFIHIIDVFFGFFHREFSTGCQASVVEDSDAMMRWAKNFKATQGFKETPRVKRWTVAAVRAYWSMLANDIYGDDECWI